MASVSPGIRVNQKRKIPRKSKFNHDDLSFVGTVLIRFTDWDGTNPGMKYRKTDLPAPDNKQTLFYQHLNLLNDLAWCFPDPEVPLFSGFMSNAHNVFASTVDQRTGDKMNPTSFIFYRSLTLTQQTSPAFGPPSVGTPMEGCGFQEALEQTIAKISVPQVLSGKAQESAFRAQMLAATALNRIILKMVLYSSQEGD